MSDQPLNPFHPPQGLGFTVNASPSAIGSAFFILALLFWGIYTVVAVYHWVRFSHAAAVAYPAIILHILISAILIFYAFSGLVGLLV